MAKQETLAQHLNKVTNPQNWKKEFKNQVLELLESIAELYMIDKALETLIDNGKKLSDFQDQEIRERMKTIIAGGLPSKQDQNAGKRPIAPIIWELFNIRLYPHKGNTSLNENIEDLIEYLRIHGIENITICKERSEWFESLGYGKLGTAIKPLVRFLRIIEEHSSSGFVKTLVDEVIELNNRTVLDEQRAKKIIKYIPLPSQEANDLKRLFNRVIEAFWNLAPGKNPYITFALSVDTVIAHDLLDLVNGNQVDFVELVRILDYIALEDRRNAGDISCKNIHNILSNMLSGQAQNLYSVLLYTVWSEPKYGKPEHEYHMLNWVHKFCCYAYGVGCFGVKWDYFTGTAYRFEELIYGSATLKEHICTYMLSEVRRVLQKIANTRNIVSNVVKIIHETVLRRSASLLDESSRNLSGYNKYWNKVYDIRNTGALYSPAFTIQLHTYTDRYGTTHTSTGKDLWLNIPPFCGIASKIKDLIKTQH